MAKEVLALLTKNYRIFASLNNIPLDESPVEDDNGEAEDDDMDDMDVDNNIAPSRRGEGGDEADEWEGFGMDVDDDDEMPAFFKEMAAEKAAAKSAVPKTPSKRKKTKVEELVRKKILKVLETTKLHDKRARQCDQNDFLRLLFAVGRRLPIRQLVAS